jgi:Reverse transcriptase (RNA-dependent DNA polymerase)
LGAPDQIASLEAPFVEEEIRKVVFSCNPNKASGPDGFSFQFYQSFWDLISRDICKLVNAFYFNQLDVSKLNLATICLIPKKKDASLITNYRPINLINCSFKIITKILADRLAKVMDEIIDYSQTTYIKDHYIMDNVVCVHEVLHQIKISKTKGVLFQIYFEKGFDRVDWDFLVETLKGRGFGTKWIEWITNILNDSKTYINFNGELDLYFHYKRGVRQGDPFPPFLYILVADVLNIVLQNAKDKSYINGLRCKGDFLGLINLYFADDTLLFLEANPRYIEALK